MIRLDGKRKDIARLALQSAVAAAGAFLILQWTGTGEAFLAVISAVLVLQPARDETIGSAGSRMVGTMVGTLVGVAALAITSDQAVALSLAVVMLIMGGIAAWKPGWRYGIVAAAGLAVGSEAGFLETAQNRGIAIFVGAGVGMAVGFLVWPESARARARRQMADALSICRDLITDTLSTALEQGEGSDGELHSRFARKISAARDTAHSIKLGGRPGADSYRDAVHRIERLWHALIILDRITETQRGESLPVRPGTIDKVKQIRSATCNALACCERFERIPGADLDTLEHACREIWEASEVKPGRDNELQSVALVFGLCEVSRNMREIDQAICAIGAAR